MLPITADGNTDSVTVSGAPTQISMVGTFGSGTVGLEENISGTWTPVLDDLDVAIAYTADNSRSYNLGIGSNIRLATTGSTTPSIKYKIKFGR